MEIETIVRTKPFEILLIEDNPGDIRLISEAFREGNFTCTLNTVNNGVEAINYLCRIGNHIDAPRPDLILLDLNLPKKDGREVLIEIKTNRNFQPIPVVVFTSSGAQQDIINAYALQANCYVTKPVDLDELIDNIQCIADFWLNTAQLPREEYVVPC